ncbi:DUF4870 domain-containing protein [Macrococcus lamae]|uniref:DUF4870 domain-containing protein n=1 Tax=Macrococcus lamae TaxID=198484 RepID=A0A4R6BTX6_9STAP|nr:DUF4870 domain-containing protein [Macrococcus lamae]TDM07923.1 DUF4870 domain-containing protein [Macrococcus lamae]
MNEYNEIESFSAEDRMLGMLIYASSFFAPVVAPLLIWLLKREQSPFIDIIGKDYLNFLISYSIWGFIAGILCFVLIGLIILPIISILAFVFTIVGAVKAFNGEFYLPPFSIRFLH